MAKHMRFFIRSLRLVLLAGDADPLPHLMCVVFLVAFAVVGAAAAAAAATQLKNSITAILAIFAV